MTDKEWASMTPDERYDSHFRTWRSAPGVQFVSDEARERYEQALQRLRDVIELRVPDRVPFMPVYQMYPVYAKGMTAYQAMYDYPGTNQAWKEAILATDPDLQLGPLICYPGPAFEALDYKVLRWPGHGLPHDKIYQFVEDEYMRADEYDELLFDPTDYMLRKYYPRVYGIMNPLSALTPQNWGLWLGMLYWSAGFAAPGVGEAFQKMVDAGKKMLDWLIGIGGLESELQGLGYPNMVGGMTFAPFDFLGDTMRGTKGIMLDMYRRPEKLLAGIDKMTKIAIDMGVSTGKGAGNPMVWMFLHKGAGGLMSNDQFATFYWPSLRKLLLALIEEGLTPVVYSEGDYTPRLEQIADLPPGKVIWHFETVDYRKAKEILGSTMCFMGNVPNSLLQTATPADVDAYCKGLIEVVGRDGGLILDTAAALDEAKPQNVIAMRDAARTYGRYR